MNLPRNKYDLVFFGFMCSVVLVFFYLRPLNSQWDRVINGDGLGYYAYLPAKYIYNDANYEFKWFNAVYTAHYAPGTFSNPEDNLLVAHGDRKINKYYQGLSFVWLPFFAVAHSVAKYTDYPADGFSPPYQVAIAFASLLYLLTGLLFLKKLLHRLFKNEFAETLVPILLFYGTSLFNYSVYYNSLSHLYSFTFCVLFSYALVSVFDDRQHQGINLLLCILWLVISVCIRPLNGLIVFLIPAFLPPGFFKKKFYFGGIKFVHVVLVLLIAGALIHQLSITHLQTGSFFPDTYTGETFHFDRSVFFEALFGYRLGLFVYSPLLILALPGLIYLPLRKGLVLAFLFFGILYLYSCWWYWPIVKRAMVDFYVIPAVFLGAFFNGLTSSARRVAWLGAAGLAVVFFQFKNYQFRHGILDEFYTYKEVFWRNFFRTRPATMFLIDPASVLKKEAAAENFGKDFPGNKTEIKKHEGDFSLLLDSKNYISEVIVCPFPALFSEDGNKKIRLSLWMYAGTGITQVHVFLKFLDKDGQLIGEVPFYLNKESLFTNTWDYKEFGMELADKKELVAGKVNRVSMTVWNVDARSELYIDEAKIEFLLTDPANETFK